MGGPPRHCFLSIKATFPLYQSNVSSLSKQRFLNQSNVSSIKATLPQSKQRGPAARRDTGHETQRLRAPRMSACAPCACHSEYQHQNVQVSGLRDGTQTVPSGTDGTEKLLEGKHLEGATLGCFKQELEGRLTEAKR
jgi:hypothetical protein